MVNRSCKYETVIILSNEPFEVYLQWIVIGAGLQVHH